MPALTTPAKSLVRKLAEVMQSVARIPKNGRNDFHKYDYVTEADLVEAVRGLLAERSVFVFTSVESSQRSGDITEVVTLHTFVDGETGEEFSVKGYGQGQDKGYKAMTGAMKYAIMKNFLVATGDDPEQDGGKPAAQKSVPAKRPAAAKSPPPVAAAHPTLTKVLEYLTDCKTLLRMQAVYDRAFTHAWQPADAAAITDCFLNVYARLSNWKRTGLKFFGGDNLMKVHVELDAKGKATVVQNKAAETLEGKELAAAADVMQK